MRRLLARVEPQEQVCSWISGRGRVGQRPVCVGQSTQVSPKIKDD